MKGMKKYTQSFDTTKQLAKERMGKAENSTDPQETKDLKEKLHLIKWSLKSMKYQGEEYVSIQEKDAEKSASLGEVMKASGTGLLAGSSIGDALLATGELLHNNSPNVKACSTTATAQLVVPVDKIYKEEIKPVMKIKSKQEMARLKYESASVKLKDLQKKQEKEKEKESKKEKEGKKEKENKSLIAAEEEYNTAKKAHEDLTKELHKASEGVIELMTRALLPQLRTYAAFQASFYANAAEQWKQLEQKLGAAERVGDSSIANSVMNGASV